MLRLKLLLCSDFSDGDVRGDDGTLLGEEEVVRVTSFVAAAVDDDNFLLGTVHVDSVTLSISAVPPLLIVVAVVLVGPTTSCRSDLQ